MQRIPIPVDGSRNSEFAVRHVITEFMKDSAKEVHLLNVQPPLSKHVAQFVSRRNSRRLAPRPGREGARAGPPPARAARRSLREHLQARHRAKVIVDEARRLRCHHIVMSTARKNSLTRMLQDSTTDQVLEHTSVPVELIAGNSVSRLERWGVPASAGALLALLIAAVD